MAAITKKTPRRISLKTVKNSESKCYLLFLNITAQRPRFTDHSRKVKRRTNLGTEDCILGVDIQLPGYIIFANI